MKITRRKFLGNSTKISAAAILGGGLGLGKIPGYTNDNKRSAAPTHPNILFLMVDQMQVPPEGYKDGEGVAKGLKEILGFRPLSSDNTYTQFFPGFLRLRQNAVILRKHYTASAACVPSRTSILTGQYPEITGVDQTDGLFKPAEDVPWLDPDGVPTVGDWFRAAGYTTHYFGKWHVSEPKFPDYLKPWGFEDWELSSPEAHGGPADNAGAFRDVEFADKLVTFLQAKKTDTSGTPWFAVGSLLNPHDCSIWPINWQALQNKGVVSWSNYPPPPSIPKKGDISRAGGVGIPHNVELNPDGFPQDNSTLPPTYSESLHEKPRCQMDYSLKWGLAFSANIDYNFQPYTDIRSPQPFQLQGANAEAWSLAYEQFYFYCHYLVDLQLRRILQALDDNGLTDDTIIVFLSDHGELAGAHGGMIQKWHNAYEETVRVPMIISSPLVNSDKQSMREITQTTSSIDFLPTVLAMAGFDLIGLKGKMETIHGKQVVKPFAGANLSSYINGTAKGEIVGPDGKLRTGVLFVTNDSITDLCDNPDDIVKGKYELFKKYVQEKIDKGLGLAPGSVRQPNCVRALCTGNWKIVRYFDPTGVERDEWELYCLTTDPVEKLNLVNFRTGEIRPEATVPGMTMDELRSKNLNLRSELARQEIITSMDAKTQEIRSSLQLFQNYPNPFNQQTIIPFYVPETSFVRLSVTDISGKEVQVLVNKTLQSGVHQFELHAGHLSPGIYFIKLNSDAQQVMKKMILTR
jgi:arylsulfatase A-like enzyme